MKITLNIDFDTNNHKDIEILSGLTESIRIVYDSAKTQPTEASYEEAWKQCSWEIIAFAVSVLKIRDGESTSKGIYAFFESLCNPDFQGLCGPLTERSISSRVGRTAVICKNMGDFRLMEVAIRRNDKAKRVYITPEAHEALLKLLQGPWGKDFNNFLMENGLEPQDFKDL